MSQLTCLIAFSPNTSTLSEFIRTITQGISLSCTHLSILDTHSNQFSEVIVSSLSYYYYYRVVENINSLVEEYTQMCLYVTTKN